MKKINKILLSVCCVTASAVMFYMGQQRSLINAFVLSNVEALVNPEVYSEDNIDWIHPGSSEAWATGEGYHSRIKMCEGCDKYWCGSYGWITECSNPIKCYVPVEIN